MTSTVKSMFVRINKTDEFQYGITERRSTSLEIHFPDTKKSIFMTKNFE
ncbi:hypothetical protein LSS_19760 [Leptospira santarosai serovar Shermani str. LT 821]|uniref:Uncharacterized protein n=1 Tax=Leptospira santarosai serovar Shermani str. LT 821 TaxID=758847 RepID=K8XVW0_9LEPT|nr:hypothetical protein LSS_19760 [Leptospira santarosai serovar Shermani str. LT 821]